MSMEFDLPIHKIEAIIHGFGSSGEAWVDRYPELLKDCIERWNLKLLGTAAAGLAINVIFFCEDGGGRPVVLKIGHPHPEQTSEIIALRKYAGRHIASIIDWDAATGSFLMERVSPGDKFRNFSNDISRSQMQIPLFRHISIPAESVDGLPTYSEWVERGFKQFRENHTSVSQNDPGREFLTFIECAESAFASICVRHPKPYLLHGDLHHENILRSGPDGWLAIDPKGVIGPRVMECGRFLHNFIVDEIPGVDDIRDATNDQILRVFKARFKTFSKLLDVNDSDIIAAGYVDLVLSTCWSINSDQEVNLKTIGVLRELL